MAHAGNWSHGVFYLDAYEDRKVLLEAIFPAIYALSPPPKRLLWIGVQPYTLRYEYLLGRHGIEMSTVEMDPVQAMYGSSIQHMIGPVQDVAKHFQASSFDVVGASPTSSFLSCLYIKALDVPSPAYMAIHLRDCSGSIQCVASQERALESNVSKQVIINGVIGWGVDSAPDIDAAFQALHTVLKRR